MEDGALTGIIFGILAFGVIAFYGYRLWLSEDLQYHQKRMRFNTLGLFLCFPLNLAESPLSYAPNLSAIAMSFSAEFKAGSWYWHSFYTHLPFTVASIVITGLLFILVSQRLFIKE